MKTKMLFLGVALAAMLPAQIAPSVSPLPSRDVLADHYLQRAYLNAMQSAMLAGLGDASAVFALRAEVFAEVAEELRGRDFFKP